MTLLQYWNCHCPVAWLNDGSGHHTMTTTTCRFSWHCFVYVSYNSYKKMTHPPRWSAQTRNWQNVTCSTIYGESVIQITIYSNITELPQWVVSRLHLTATRQVMWQTLCSG